MDRFYKDKREKEEVVGEIVRNDELKTEVSVLNLDKWFVFLRTVILKDTEWYYMKEHLVGLEIDKIDELIDLLNKAKSLKVVKEGKNESSTNI